MKLKMFFLGAMFAVLANNATAAPTKDSQAGTLVFPTNNDYIVVARSGAQVCNHLDANWTCTTERGKYRWRDLTAVEEGYFWSLNTDDQFVNDTPTEHTEPAGSALPSSNFGGVSLAEVQALIDALSAPDGVIDSRAYAVFQANCTVTP